MIKKIFSWVIGAVIVAGFAFAAQQTILSSDTLNEAWTKEAANNSEFPIKTANETISGDWILSGDITIGAINSPTPVHDAAADFAANFTGTDLKGGHFVCDVTGTIQLPAIAAGMNFTITTFGAIAVVIEPNASDSIILDGVQLDDADSATNLSTAGDVIVFEYDSAAGWLATSNGWTDED